MNVSQIKSKWSIADYLSSIGHEPARKNGNQWMYHSPLHEDNKPSFSINILDNIWHDFADGTGGDLIDLVKLLDRTNTAGAIATFTGISNSKPVFSFYQQNLLNNKGNTIRISRVQPIRNQALINYLIERKIPISTARYYLQEAYYKTFADQKDDFFAVAFKNDKGGYVLRNKILIKPITTKPAYFTTIPGKWNDQVNVFEGIFDFLSALVYFKSEIPKLDCIVLNSNSHLKSALPLIANYSRVNLFLDNDAAGVQAAEKIRSCNKNVVDYSEIIYPGNKDFNEFLTSNQK